MKQLGCIFLLVLFSITLSAQENVGIGTTQPEASAQLEIRSKEKGLLVPRMTSVERNAIRQPATGLIVYQTTAPAGFYYNTGKPSDPLWVLLIDSSTPIVSGVTAQGPLSSTGGSNPVISLRGNGGTILHGTDTGVAFTGSGLPGQILKSNGGDAPVWSDLSVGQSGGTVYGTAYAVSGSTLTLVPGLTQTINVPPNALVYITSTGGIEIPGSTSTSISVTDIFITINDVEVSDAGQQRIRAVNNAAALNAITYWSFSFVPDLAPGTHTISIKTKLQGGGSQALVSGDTNSPAQGTLTVLIFKK